MGVKKHIGNLHVRQAAAQGLMDKGSSGNTTAIKRGRRTGGKVKK